MNFLPRRRPRPPAPAVPDSQLPPADVHLTQGAGQQAAQASELSLIGLDEQGRGVHFGPGDGHVLVVAPPGMGASQLLRSLGVQALARGEQLDILDVRMISQDWARGLEHGVTYVDEPDQMHRHLMGLAHQARGRAAAGRPGPRRLLMVEKDTTAVLADHWISPRPNGMALDALTAVLAHGRLAGIQVILACSDLPGQLTGLARDLFSTRLLHDPSKRTWRRAGLADQPCSPGFGFRPGLWHHLTRDGSHRLVQAARISEGAAADFVRHSHAPRPAARTTKESQR
ncbi:hypothetical protein OG883_43825 [Streptomyces sp. NBC_01142]|uniref:hypothetical protein n=1 Tax=Streptomyces sp. NBC_01142 TaxID=2975865 RepID=UPI00224ECD5F|nr:hypothetical protein [Streptomyces sp. NBC_01142]MCX4826571.1 hypothetical protein [Streptomyces sp. NBC_01142]